VNRYYKDRSSTMQIINLNSGRAVYVDVNGVVELEGKEAESDEIVAKLRGSRPTGQLFDKDPSVREVKKSSTLLPPTNFGGGDK
jgi:hypothetical protein